MTGKFRGRIRLIFIIGTLAVAIPLSAVLGIRWIFGPGVFGPWISLSSAPFSLDGSSVLVGADGQGIYRVFLDGRRVQQITAPPAGTVDRTPAFSADGSLIVFARGSESGRYSHIYTVNVDGTELTELTHGQVEDVAPVFSSDGRIYFLRRKETVAPLWTVDIVVISETGGQSRVLSANNPHYIEAVAISPDGRQLMTVEPSKGTNSLSLLRVMSMNEPEGVTVYEPDIRQYMRSSGVDIPGVSIDDPAFAPDGSAIVFTASGKRKRGDRWLSDSTHRVYTFNLQTRETVQVADVGSHYVRWPSFSPNLREIVFCAGVPFACGSLWLVNVDGTGLRRLPLRLRGGLNNPQSGPR